jgi:archaellum component FlaC
MKFQLFGRLRDNEENDSGNESDNSLGPNTQKSMDSFGGGLQRTVENLFDQGYSEEEIRQELRGQYSEDELQNAINQAVKSSATSQQGEGPQPMTPYQGGEENVSPMDEGFSDNSGNPSEDTRGQQASMEPMDNSQPQNPDSRPQQPAQTGNQGVSQGQTDVEELIETIVAENFQKVEKEFENAYSEIDEMQEKIQDLEERVGELEVRDDEDQTQFIEKMDEIENDINEYQSRIGGLEKAFQQVLPSLVDNVRDLTQLVQEIKQERGIETSSDVSEEDIQGMDMDDWD